MFFFVVRSFIVWICRLKLNVMFLVLINISMVRIEWRRMFGGIW